MTATNTRRKTILDTALGLVRRLGFESVSINSLAKEVGMSKSGLFAHFNSKEKMHVMILDHAAITFGNDVFRESLKVARGLPRLNAIVKNWITWYKKGEGGTCPFLAAAVEYDARPGVVKERITQHTNQLIKSLNKSIDICVEEGHFPQNLDTKQATFKLYSLIMGHLLYLRMINAKSAVQIFQSSLNDLLSEFESGGHQYE